MTFQKYQPLLCVILLFFFSVSVSAQGWERNFGQYDEGQDLVIAPNGDAVILVNDYFNVGLGGSDYIQGGKIARYSPYGEQQFLKLFIGNTNAYNKYYSMCKANNGGYLVSGISFTEIDSFGQIVNPTEGILVKISESGDQEWFNRIRPDSLSIHPQKIIPSSGGGYLVAGSMRNEFTGVFSNMLMRTDNLGEPVWIKRLTPAGRTFDILELPDGNIVATGSASYSRSSDFFLMKMDASGNEIWKFVKDNPDFHYGLTIEPTQDGGFLVGAHTQVQTQFAYSLELLRFNSAGDTLWTKYVDQANSYGDLLDIKENQDGSIWAAGRLGYRMKLYKLDKNGNEISRNTFGNYTSGGNVQIRCAPDNGLFLSGTNSLLPFLARTDSLGFTLTNHILGDYATDNSNCTIDSSDRRISGRLIEISKNNRIQYARTNQNGRYSIQADTGVYTLKTDVPNSLWQICKDSQVVDFQDFFKSDTINFLINETTFCPYLKVNISAPRMRRCFDNSIHVNYCNEGTKPAEDAYIEVTLDARLTATESTLPWSSQTGNTYRFDVGNLDIFECGKFQITTQHNCDSVQLGETFCMEAHIFPDSLCIPIDSLWDGSDLAVDAVCEGDSVRFEIRNNGASMQKGADFIIIEDDMVLRSGNLQAMPAFGIEKLAVAAEGSTYRIEIEQAEGHPFQTKTAASLEACGLNPIGQFSTGFVTEFPNYDSEPFFDEECIEVRGAYDPNDKTAFPKGVCSRNFIFNDTPLEYKIRFQNTGTDTAVNVEIRDTLSPLLDPMTLEIGSSSHEFEWDLTGEGILIFSFNNIMLPDSNINEPASNGFIQYKINQRLGNVVDTEIKNSASIYFDFNAPIKTNTVKHTIGDDFLTRSLGDLMISGNVTTKDGIPIDSAVVFLSNNCIAFTDKDGDYFFENIEAGFDYEIRVMKNDLAANGVTVLDIWALRDHLFRLDTLSAYSLIAADANNSNSISTIDLVAIQKVILEIADHFPNNEIWRFFGENGSFTSSVKLQNLIENSYDNNFIGIKTGDIVSELQFDSSAFKTQVKIDSTFSCGDTAIVNLSIGNQDSLMAGQLSLSWNPDRLSLLNVEQSRNLETAQFPGKLNLIFISSQSEKNIQLKFLPLIPIEESEEIIIKSTQIPPQFFTSGKKLTAVEMYNGLVTKTEKIEIDFVITNPTASNSTDGQIAIQNINGGTGIYTTVQWSTGVTGNQIVNLAPGNYTVTVTDNVGCSTTQSIRLSAPSSQHFQTPNDFKINITPNPTPANQSAVLQIKSGNHQIGEVKIHDVSGKLLWAQKYEFTKNETQILLPKSKAGGMYFVTVRFDDGTSKTIKWTLN